MKIAEWRFGFSTIGDGGFQIGDFSTIGDADFRLETSARLEMADFRLETGSISGIPVDHFRSDIGDAGFRLETWLQHDWRWRVSDWRLVQFQGFLLTISDWTLEMQVSDWRFGFSTIGDGGFQTGDWFNFRNSLLTISDWTLEMQVSDWRLGFSTIGDGGFQIGDWFNFRDSC